MVLSSGNIPYSYDYGSGPFTVPSPYESDHPIGPSGILLEQAQFVITAELRKWKKFDGDEGSHTLPEFLVFKNAIVAPSGPYEPKTNGSTLGNAIDPGSICFIDHIDQTRNALAFLFNELTGDTNEDYLTSWLSALYPNNPSGRLGLYSRMVPSEVGQIITVATDILGGSGVLYDVDFGEVMFNPFPHISVFQLDTAHSISDSYNIQQGPLFPAFQKTDGTLVSVNHEPQAINNAFDNYFSEPVGSGKVMINGYCLLDGTKYYLGRTGNVFDTSSADFTHFASSARPAGNGRNIPTTRSYISPTSQASGLYRIAAVNHRSDFPTTSIESGTVSFWPPLSSYPSFAYHVFDDCIWITDSTNISKTSAAALQRGYPSGLTILSPYTMQKLWVKYADQTKYDCLPSFGDRLNYSNWGSGVGLVRASANNIYRVHEEFQKPITNVSGQLRLARYNDDLDFLTDITSTSDAFISSPGGIENNFPLGIGSFTTIKVGDIWHDPVSDEFWVSNDRLAGFPLYKFDSNFKFINKYLFNPPQVGSQMRGVFINGQHYIYYGDTDSSPHFNVSGIYAVTSTVDGTEPFNSSSDSPETGYITVDLLSPKPINGAPLVGVATFGQIMHMVEVTSSTHLTPGVYALVNWVLVGGSSGGNLYLLRIEEDATTWEIRSSTRLETSLAVDVIRRYIMYMPY